MIFVKKRKYVSYRYHKPTVTARCETCGKEWYSANAHGVGVQHAQYHGHRVIIEVMATYIYDGTGG